MVTAPDTLSHQLQEARTKRPQRYCGISGCDQPYLAKGLCRLHYSAQWRNLPRNRTSFTVDEFMSKVKKGRHDECWEWQGSRNRQGYGVIERYGKKVSAHRVSAVLHIGFDLASPLIIRHTCDNPPCVNPFHLVPGLPVENVHDAFERGRRKSKQGEDHGEAKLTTDNVNQMRLLYRGGESCSALGRRFGVTLQCVWQIVNRHAWKHLPDPSY